MIARVVLFRCICCRGGCRRIGIISLRSRTFLQAARHRFAEDEWRSGRLSRRRRDEIGI
jgi:hypothetical protein